MAQIPITRVRYSGDQAREMLRIYIFGSRYTAKRAPRGLPPDLVEKFLIDELKPETGPGAYERALEAMRFYETRSAASHLRTYLTGREASFNDLRRSAFILQALGDLGTPDEARWGADYFDRYLTRKSGFSDVVDLFVQTLLALAPAAEPSAFADRLRDAMGRPPTVQAARKLREVFDNQLPGAADLAAGKRRLLAATPDQRRRDLIVIYIGQSDLSEPYMVTWSGRMIRKDAIDGDVAPIYADFGRAIEALGATKADHPEVEPAIVRAAQAIVYLQGQLSPRWLELYRSSNPEDVQSFLWDE